jgi:hypothetical protein
MLIFPGGNMKNRSLFVVTFALLAALPASFAQADVYQDVFNNVSQANIQKLMKDMTGDNTVTVDSKVFAITDRYLPASKANFRAYWEAYYRNLGLTVNEMPYKTQYNIETQGHDVEAILPGKSADSIVIIVHYDSMGPHGSDNPAVDDDMTGMSMQMETARILKSYAGRLQYTVRFVAADYEEWGDLEGARYYAKYIKALDDEQSGWKQGDNTFDIFSCGGPTDSKALGDAMEAVATKYGSLAVNRACIGENSDHYAMWEIGVHAVVFSEHNPFDNPHFDNEGGDTYEKIDQDYLFKIAQVGITFAATVAVIQ